VVVLFHKNVLENNDNSGKNDI